jgi:hypothetical protein
MNYNIYSWYNNLIDVPNHHGTKNRNQILLWAGTDQQDLFNKNLHDIEKRKYLEKNNWLEPITYSYNNHGFRAEAFDNRPTGLALGCSFTEGVGLRIEQTWPHLLSKKLNINIWNLGIGGSAFDTVFRVLDYYLLKFNPKFVCILMPPINRFEYCKMYQQYQVVRATSKIEHSTFSKEWLTQEINGIINRRKNTLSVRQLCYEAKIPLFIEDSIIGFECEHRDFARDLQHYGINSQNYITGKFYQHISKHYDI